MRGIAELRALAGRVGSFKEPSGCLRLKRSSFLGQSSGRSSYTGAGRGAGRGSESQSFTELQTFTTEEEELWSRTSRTSRTSSNEGAGRGAGRGSESQSLDQSQSFTEEESELWSRSSRGLGHGTLESRSGVYVGNDGSGSGRGRGRGGAVAPVNSSASQAGLGMGRGIGSAVYPQAPGSSGGGGVYQDSDEQQYVARRAPQHDRPAESGVGRGMQVSSNLRQSNVELDSRGPLSSSKLDTGSERIAGTVLPDTSGAARIRVSEEDVACSGRGDSPLETSSSNERAFLKSSPVEDRGTTASTGFGRRLPFSFSPLTKVQPSSPLRAATDAEIQIPFRWSSPDKDEIPLERTPKISVRKQPASEAASSPNLVASGLGVVSKLEFLQSTDFEEKVNVPPKFEFVMPKISLAGGGMGRGRGLPGGVAQSAIGAKSEERSTFNTDEGKLMPKLALNMEENVRQISAQNFTDEALSSLSRRNVSSEKSRRSRIFNSDASRAAVVAEGEDKVPKVQLSNEDARARAIAILEGGIERGVMANGENRRRAAIDKFADATEFVANRFKRETSYSASVNPRASREKLKTQSRPRQRVAQDHMSMIKPVSQELSPEQEAELARIDQESTFKENLHRLFLVQFEPEYAMEVFGTNPDIDDPPMLSLEEYLQTLKPMFVGDGGSDEQEWQESMKRSLTNAPQLEKLVESYAGRGRMTARQEIAKLQSITETLPSSAPTELAAFTKRALLTLQNNPGWSYLQKERLLKGLVSGFSSC